MHVYSEFTHGMQVYAILCEIYACYTQIYAWFTLSLSLFTHGLPKVYPGLTQGLRNIDDWFTQGLHRFAKKNRYVYAGLSTVHAKFTQSLRKVYVEGISTTNVRKPA
jgi:hypothetical protein